jgi:hypothetical protein
MNDCAYLASVSPPCTATVLLGSIQSNQDRSELAALRRLGTVEDCAKGVEFLATDLSDYVTGAVIAVDGARVRGGVFRNHIARQRPIAAFGRKWDQSSGLLSSDPIASR